jgi:ubiquitin carboxyl-terminal hydrolase 8
MSSPLAPLESTSRPSSAPDVLSEPVASTSRLTLAIGVSPTSSQPSTASAFGYNFPSFSEFDSRFPEVPSHEPANGIPYNAPPPARADFGSGIKRSPALETLRSPPQESTGRFSEDGAASRPKHASNAVSGPNRSLPRTNFILPDALWAYLHPPSDDQPSVLLLDVRDRTDFERCRIRAAHTVCIEPITLRQEVPSQRLEASLVLSPDAERHAFLSRDRFDLVVIYDRSSTTIPSHAPSVTLQSTEDPARCLFNLQAAIFEREYHRSLRRPPVILVGGLEAWIRAVGTKGLDGSEAAEVGGQAAARSRSGTNGSIAEASARLEGADGRRGSVGSLSANEAKRTHRKASITPAGEVGYGQQPGLSRSVVDVVRRTRLPC